MEFSMKDFDTVAGDGGGGGTATVNVQHKKQFDGIADVDLNAMKLMNEDWNIDSIFPLNNDFLNEFGDFHDINMDMETKWEDAYDYMSSPTSTGTESENDILDMKPIVSQMLSPPQNLISSSSSDSGLSSDHHIEFDMNFDTDLLQQPLLSTQIIPELADEEPVCKLIKTESDDQVMYPANAVVPLKQKIIADSKAKLSTEGKRIEIVQINNGNVIQDNGPKRKIQIVKKIAPNIVQAKDAIVPIKQEVVAEPLVSNAPIVINKVNGNISGIRKVIQVKKGPNQKSIFLPISLKNGTDIRSIKIIKPSILTKSPKILMAASNLLQEYKQNEIKQNTVVVNNVHAQPEFKYESESVSDPSDCESYKFEDMIVRDDEDIDIDDDYNNDSDQADGDGDQQSEYPKLVLSGEEKRLLAKEGITLPAHYPLTKHEERELKRIRRKIRNKISAQDSRKRKKEYVDGLEERVKKCTDENQTLLKRIKLLQSQNQNLINQMKKMQNLLTKGGNKTVQPATCLMILLMSMALVATPNLRNNTAENTDANPLAQEFEESSMQQNEATRRMLLFDSQDRFSDALVDEEMIDMGSIFGKAEINEHNYAETQWAAMKTEKKLGELIDFDVDDTVWSPPNANKSKADAVVQSGDQAINNIKRELEGLAGIPSNMVVAHTKTAKNLSELPADEPYQLKLMDSDLSNLIKLNADLNAKKV